MSFSGKMSSPRMRETRHVQVQDGYTHIKIWRGEGGESLVTEFMGQIALGTTGVTGTDKRSVPGDVSPQLYVMYVTLHRDVLKHDEVWEHVGGATLRYRVITVTPQPHQKEVVMKLLQ